MKIHAINCGWMRPWGGLLWDRHSTGVGPASLACRCVVVEGPEGPILVDTGFGPTDEAEPERIPAPFRLMNRPDIQPHRSALARVRALGFAPEDVRHIVMTHLDFDHAGGLTDFPWAKVHVTAKELSAAQARDGVKARLRWSPGQLRADFVGHEAPGEPFFGMETVDGLPAGLRLVPLPGHSPGHAGVAIPAEKGWVVHAGDAIFDARELEGPGKAPPLALAYESAMQSDPTARHASAEALRLLRRQAPEDITILCTHDPVLHPSVRMAAEPGLND
ncbi:MBL fold metallo-hydrolase [Sabulicella glaciei]|uniref:MBL fold metallo-hydrolase n=1 Tax=Sabulicella glaciei TaxID=2984948 RepID=A0ABT3NWQ2_9PROT|nr:MBL fold metallo-hydrolase [Roseococcus sp. MDT2-1-1]MCW8086551.1 MBL fold metallo-hydrolase [Roseococcus sp. MDT2-1-1]